MRIACGLGHADRFNLRSGASTMHSTLCKSIALFDAAHNMQLLVGNALAAAHTSQ